MSIPTTISSPFTPTRRSVLYHWLRVPHQHLWSCQPWRRRNKESQWRAILSTITSCAQGNLNWLAAFEVEPATQSIYVNAWKEEKTLTPEVAGRRLRGAVTDAIQVRLAAENYRM